MREKTGLQAHHHRDGREVQVRIVGASMAGAAAGIHCAREFRKAGEGARITIYEEHQDLHKTCSGIVTGVFAPVLERAGLALPRELVLSHVTGVRIYAPSGKYLSLRFRTPDLIFDRERLNEHFIGIAEREGCDVRMHHRFSGFADGSKGILVEGTQAAGEGAHELACDVLVAADGALSSVAKAAGLWPAGERRRHYLAVKALVPCEHDNAIEFYPFVRDFAWRNPVGDGMLEVGVATEQGPGVNASAIFDLFCRRFPEHTGRIGKKEAALIPIYDPHAGFFTRVNGIPVYAIGDAATHAKATTGGSIVQIHQAAPILARHAVAGTSHERDVRKAIGRDLALHLKMHEIMRRFTDEDWEGFVASFNRKGMRSALERGSRDKPVRLAANLLLRNPLLLKYMTKLF